MKQPTKTPRQVMKTRTLLLYLYRFWRAFHALNMDLRKPEAALIAQIAYLYADFDEGKPLSLVLGQRSPRDIERFEEIFAIMDKFLGKPLKRSEIALRRALGKGEGAFMRKMARLAKEAENERTGVQD